MKNAILIAGFVATMVSCKLEPDLGELVQDMLVATYYDEVTMDTATYETFYLRLDTLGFVSNRYADTIVYSTMSNDFFASFAEEIPVAVQGEMLNIGFSQVDQVANPDLIVNVAILDNLNVFLSYNYGSYYSGYYGYYGYYTPYYTYNAEEYGTLLIEILDGKNYQANNNRYKVIWSAYIGDLYTSVDPLVEVNEAITQAFLQSPYIHAN